MQIAVAVEHAVVNERDKFERERNRMAERAGATVQSLRRFDEYCGGSEWRPDPQTPLAGFATV